MKKQIEQIIEEYGHRPIEATRRIMELINKQPIVPNENLTKEDWIKIFEERAKNPIFSAPEERNKQNE